MPYSLQEIVQILAIRAQVTTSPPRNSPLTAPDHPRHHPLTHRNPNPNPNPKRIP